VRIVGATNEDLSALAGAGSFRADLLDRLAFDVVHVPPLRARPEDILALAQHFAVNFTAEMKRPYFAGFTPEATEALLAWPWPGNVRELKNAVERSIYRAGDPAEPVDRIHFDPFAHDFGAAGEPPSGTAATPPGEKAGPGIPADFRAAVAAYERRLLDAALAAADGNRRVAAERLGLSYDQLRGLLRRHRLGKGRSGRPPAS
jgi:psp operon transcriptional activator